MRRHELTYDEWAGTQTVVFTFLPCCFGEKGGAHRTDDDEGVKARAGRGIEAGRAAPERAGAGQGAWQRRRGMPSAQTRPDALLRVEAAVPDAGLRKAQGPAANPQELPRRH